MAKVFKWQVTSESTAKHSFNVRTVKFGNGYEQRQKLTLNLNRLLLQCSLLLSLAIIIPGRVMCRMKLWQNLTKFYKG